MAVSNGFWPLNLSVESLVLRGIVPTRAPLHKGPAKKQIGDPRGGRVGQSTKRDGVRFSPDIFCRIFELPSPRNAQKRDKKIGFGFLVVFFVKDLSTQCFL
jgi:hypothetical protein